MKKTCSFFSLFILLLIMHSCEKDANIDLPVVENKLVVTCFISPQDSVIKVRVSQSQPLYNNPDVYKFLPVTDATVVLSSASASITIPYNTQLERYTISAALFKVQVGGSYRLSVSTPDGKFVQAFTSIPDFNSSFTLSVTKDQTKINTYFLHALWQDPAGIKNYYQLDLGQYVGQDFSSYEATLIKDDEGEGQVLRRDWEIIRDPNSADTLYESLHVLTPELYEYMDRLDKTFTGIDPFSEPVPMYTNIEGGFGVFGGHYATYRKVPF